MFLFFCLHVDGDNHLVGVILFGVCYFFFVPSRLSTDWRRNQVEKKKEPWLPSRRAGGGLRGAPGDDGRGGWRRGEPRSGPGPCARGEASGSEGRGGEGGSKQEPS